MRLSSLQHWMQAVVVHPGTTKEALRSQAASKHLPHTRLQSVLLPSQRLSAAERIHIYQEMYPFRMRDAVSSDYPAIEHFLGDRFRDFVAAYTSRHPSMSYTLNRLGDHVPDFLGRQTRFKPRAFLKDLARLELAVTEAFDAPQASLLDAKGLEALLPQRLGRSHLLTVPSLRLVSLAWNAGDYLDSVRDEQHKHPKPRKAQSFIAVVRRNYSVYRFPVSEAAFCVLQDLKEGRPIGRVAERALARRGQRGASADDFASWFKSWTSEGLFSAVRSPKKRLTNQ